MSRTPEGWVRRLYWEDSNGDRLTLAALVYSENGNLAVVRRTVNLDHVAAYAQWTTERLNAAIDSFAEYLAGLDLFEVHTYGFPKPSPIQLGRPEPIYSGPGTMHLLPNNVAGAIATTERGTKRQEHADIEWIYGPVEEEWHEEDAA